MRVHIEADIAGNGNSTDGDILFPRIEQAVLAPIAEEVSAGCHGVLTGVRVFDRNIVCDDCGSDIGEDERVYCDPCMDSTLDEKQEAEDNAKGAEKMRDTLEDLVSTMNASERVPDEARCEEIAVILREYGFSVEYASKGEYK